MNVIAYCTEEVERQGHDTTIRDGIERVGWMLDAWSLCLSWTAIGWNELEIIGQCVERKKNAIGFRRCDVWVGGRKCPSPSCISELIKKWVIMQGTRSPFENYRALLEIHPFVDGNGRTGKVILNWLNNTLLHPIFPPNNFWGTPIRNP